MAASAQMPRIRDVQQPVRGLDSVRLAFLIVGNEVV